MLGLVSNGATEGEQLEFKKETYRKTVGPRAERWTQELEFCKDVAALANHRGGLLLIGIDEIDGVATEVTPVFNTSSEREEQRLRAAALNFLSPPVETSFVPIPVAGGGFCLGVVIAPSPRAPHAVLSDPGDPRKSLRYPVRHGAGTSWLSETEVSERHRRRFAAQDQIDARRDRVLADGIDALVDSDALWTFSAIVPDAVMEARLDGASLRSITEWAYLNVDGSPLGHTLGIGGRAIPAPGRVTLTGNRYRDDQDPAAPYDGYAALYLNGAAFVATTTSSDAASPRRLNRDQVVDDLIMTGDLGLRWAARQLGAWGSATMVGGFVDSGSADGQYRQALELGGWRFGRDDERLANTRAVHRQVSAATAASLEATTTMQGRLSHVGALASAVLQHFGLAEAEQLAPDGAIRSSAWPVANHRSLEAWATSTGVAFIPLSGER